MKRILIFILAVSSCAFAQENRNVWFYQGQGPGPVIAGGVGAFGGAPGVPAPVQGAPYSATTTNESVQTLADGNRIVQTSTGTIARDSQGRTRQDTALPPIGNLSAANAPHLVFLQDPVAQVSYTLNLTDKTAQKIPVPPFPPGGPGPAGGSNAFFVQMGDVATAPGPFPPQPAIAIQKGFVTSEQGQVSTEDLGSQTMEGVFVKGVRTTRTIPAGQIGNEQPISIVTEVWTSPDLKTIVYSKRSDPRMGEQTFRLTNIVTAEPDASSFSIPADFKIIDGPKPIIYRPNQ
jgi:hypothetical protein